jgi:hypothetical protein
VVQRAEKQPRLPNPNPRVDVPNPVVEDNQPPDVTLEQLNIAGSGLAVTLDAGGAYSNSSSLTSRDPLVQGKHYKVYSVQFQQGQSYQLDMASNQLDSFLFVLNPNNRTVAADDDGGEDLNASLRYQARETGMHRIVATSFEPRMTGSFTLTIRRVAP